MLHKLLYSWAIAQPQQYPPSQNRPLRSSGLDGHFTSNEKQYAAVSNSPCIGDFSTLLMEESLSSVRVSFGGPKVTFPLPKGYFSDVQVSGEQTQEYRDLIRHRLGAAVSDEKCCNERLDHGLPHLRPNDWKSTRSFDGLQLFQCRRQGRSTAELAAEADFSQAVDAVTSGQASVVAIGSIPGTIEDVLYGFAGTTDEETRTSLSFLLRKTDAAVLHTFEVGTDENPLHYFGLKWLYAAKTMRAARDICCLHAMGVDTDESGESYGYLVLHSVELPECPPFHKKSKVVRSKVCFSCIFRETTPGFVDVFARVIFDMSGGRRLFPMTRYTTNAFIGGLRRLVDCAEAKKLTLLARRTAFKVNLGEPLVQLPPPPKRAVCAVCIKRDKSGLFAGTHLQTCRVCGIPVCAKCQVKHKRVFFGYDRPWSVVACCPKCALEAQRLTNIRPSQIDFAVTADFFIRTSINSAPVAMTSFGLSLAEQVARCVGISGANYPMSSRNAADQALESNVVARDSDGANFSDSWSDLGASQICPNSRRSQQWQV